ncbi:MAG: acetyl-CoA C-acyltransferase [Candidatus Kapabacteria bacterium]|nr:acetyl-CoA C-acyltransferase [Candidatus Kapabacteria bacterium]
MSESANHAYICAPLRTPFGKYGGALASVRPDDLGAMVIRAVVERSGVPAEAIDDVIMGCANQAGEDNRNVARMSALLAGLPHTVPGVTVNRLCASSLEAVIQASRAVRCGDARLIVAGGVESMSRAPYSLPKNVSGGAMFGNLTAYDTALGWRYPNAKMEALFPLETMGETAENIAERWAIAREDQDAFALQSHARAVAAREAGTTAEELIAVELVGRKGAVTVVDTDEQPRRDTTLEQLATLKPAFRKGGSVTAGNASSLNDGAAAMLIASGEAVQTYGLQPLARIVGTAAAGVDPRIMGIGPVPAIRKACERAGINVDDLGLVEINEAFAAQALACVRELGLDHETVNVNGGAIAIGHPLGASGGRILGALVREMQRRNVRHGAAALCIGVGQGLAVVVERV